MAETMNVSEVKYSSPDQSDPEGDTFEDAQDAVNQTPPQMHRQPSTASTRSLTGGSSARQSPRPPSNSSNPNVQSPPSSAEAPRSVPEENDSDEAERPKAPRSVAERVAALQQQKGKASPKPTGPPMKRQSGAKKPADLSSQRSQPKEEPSESPEKTPKPTKKPSAEYSTEIPKQAAENTESVESKTAESVPEATDDVPLATPKPPKRSSAAFQEVELSSVDGKEEEEEEQHAETQEERGRKMSLDSPHSPRSTTTSNSESRSASRVPSMSEKAPHSTSSTFNFASWGSSKNSASHASGKKMSGPWGWLSRKKTVPDVVPPSQQVGHRQGSVGHSSGSGKPDLKLNNIEQDPIPAKDQLKERFKLARMKEEAGISADQIETPRSSVTSGADGANEAGSNRASDPSGTVHSPASNTSVNEAASSPVDPPKRGHKARAPSMAQSISVDPNLAPGMVSGINHGPSSMADPEAPVDWDLWQSVVYEGPAAVAKTSAAELSRSIASGIPNPIRGVVWQVLAQSKNEELENKYHELAVRGTDREIVTSPRDTNPPQSAKSLTSNDASKDSVASSASSVRSEAEGVASPVASTNQETEANAAKAQAAREKKRKEEQAAIKRLEKTIRKDLGARSNYSKYFAAKEMQDDLFGVCKAYALYDEAVGYAQGMNFIVMPLLFNMSAEEAFCLLVSLMNHYKLRETFTPEMPGLHKQLYQFERILEEENMKLCRHLSRKGITPSLYATQWFITLFAYKFPLQLVLRVYDLVLSEGLESAILKFGVALMQKNAEKLLAIQDMAALKTFLNERLFDAYIDSSPSPHSILEQGFFGSSGGSEKDVYRADLLVQDACAVSISAEILKHFADEYETKAKAEKDKQTELDELRTTVSSQTIKVRSLEERVEKSDTEHVQITQEMIKSRMENEDLRNTGMEQLAEIEKLKKELASAPEKVETSLKEEMERIMARNTEVQSQNRVLEEQMADMEKDLVQTKMQFAQINADYEALKQKWSDLRRALGD